MRNLFRSGTALFVIAGILFLASVITTVRHWMTDNGSPASSGGAVAVGVVMFVLGIVVRRKNTK